MSEGRSRCRPSSMAGPHPRHHTAPHMCMHACVQRMLAFAHDRRVELPAHLSDLLRFKVPSLIHARMYTCTQKCVDAPTDACASMCTRTHEFTHMSVHKRTHTCVHACMHACMHARMHLCVQRMQRTHAMHAQPHMHACARMHARMHA